jgi:hypothetical protein
VQPLTFGAPERPPDWEERLIEALRELGVPAWIYRGQDEPGLLDPEDIDEPDEP